MNSGRPDGICLNPPVGRSTRRKVDPPGFLEDVLDNRPLIREMRNAAQSRQVSGDFAEFRPIGREFRRIGRAADQRAAGIFQDFLETLLNRSQIHEVRNPALSPQLGGAFAEFRPIGRDSAGYRPFAPRPSEIF